MQCSISKEDLSQPPADLLRPEELLHGYLLDELGLMVVSMGLLNALSHLKTVAHLLLQQNMPSSSHHLFREAGCRGFS